MLQFTLNLQTCNVGVEICETITPRVYTYDSDYELNNACHVPLNLQHT